MLNDKEKYNLKLGEALKYYREKANMTQLEASRKLGKSRTWIADKEQGRGDIYFGLLITLCELYGITTNDINDYINAK